MSQPVSLERSRPVFSWNILNYGRIRQAIFAEESVFKQILFDYRNLVLTAQREVEDGIVDFIKRNEQFEFDKQTADANAESVELSIAEFKAGKSDFSRVFVVQANLVSAQDQVVVTKANIALALINTYRALGGGWEAQCHDSERCYSPSSLGLESNNGFDVVEFTTTVEAEVPEFEVVESPEAESGFSER